ncbi:hypothetical protein SAMN02910456_01971 [Ruminococcaceae bacterium YRB3002]|nr:hypothetical protein SAMN02910456_01971 [Ruminococcaceae bacterium YRB3002]
MIKVKMLSLVLAVFLIIPISSCAHEDEKPEYQCGNRDYEEEYYSSQTKRMSLQEDSSIITVLKNCDDYSFVTMQPYGETNDDGFIYTVITYDDSLSNIKNSFELDVRCELYSICLVGDTEIACSTSNGYVVYDYDSGKRLFSDEITGQYYKTIVSPCKDGLMLITSDTAYKYDTKGELIDKITYNDIGAPHWRCACFEQRGKYYYVNQEYEIYQIDFEIGNALHVLNINELGRPFEVGNDGKMYDYIRGVFYEIDVESKALEICALRSHMLVKPRIYNKEYEDKYYFFGRYDYVIVYSYANGMYDISLVYKDDSLNISERDKITIKGFGVNDDLCLLHAAYKYNTSQDRYFVELEPYDSEYNYSTAIDAENVKMKLIKEFNEGNSPDIYYGNFFDFDYWGRNGMVIDMIEEVDKSAVISDSSIIKNMYDLMCHDGRCYCLFSGYRINGLISPADLVSPDAVVDYSLYGNSRFADGMKGYYSSIDIVDFMIRYPIANMVRENRFFTVEEIERILEYGYSIGVSNQDKYGDDDIIINGDDDLTVKQTMIVSIPDYARITDNMGMIRYYGYPSVGGTVNTIEPFGLVAISSGSEHPDACFDFLTMMFSKENQQELFVQQVMPVNSTVSDRYLQLMSEPENIPDTEEFYKMLSYEMIKDQNGSYYHLNNEEQAYFKEMISSVDTMITIDWGIYNIIAEEVESYYLQGKDIHEIAKTLHNRLLLYVQENY